MKELITSKGCKKEKLKLANQVAQYFQSDMGLWLYLTINNYAWSRRRRLYHGMP